MDDTFEKTSITSDVAHRVIAGAEAKAHEMGTPMVIAVCDESGVLKAFSRMDGAALLAVQVAQDKAYTAVGFGLPTDGWHSFIKDDPPLALGHDDEARFPVMAEGLYDEAIPAECWRWATRNRRAARAHHRVTK